ncbi:GCN5-related N-acetyltransferase [Streptomyces laurentii]|uniref:GCN5-related N-acetyltransferase n=1 Tax=Streptomyces laurentii TaxID=39478 RepID=A0A160P7Y0_STRLU|nr:GCN5-related N-acetyltransferase [Streptomyces laurentii]
MSDIKRVDPGGGDRVAVPDTRVSTAGYRIGFADDLSAGLCEEAAGLAQQCITGCSDDRPVSASLVRSRLTNALSGEPPVLALARDGSGALAGWCAVRRPEPGELRARLWGPVVAPSARRTGLGQRLLERVVGAVEWPLVTTDVPLDRPGAAAFFAGAGWWVLYTVTVLHRPAPCGPAARVDRLVTAEGVDDLAGYVARAAQRFGGHAPASAQATLDRWRDDARFRPENLLLDPATGSLLLALAQRNAATSELLLAEVWAPQAVRPRLIEDALALADRNALAAVRAVTRDNPAPFVAGGMSVLGTCHLFASPDEQQPGHGGTPDPTQGGPACP